METKSEDNGRGYGVERVSTASGYLESAINIDKERVTADLAPGPTTVTLLKTQPNVRPIAATGHRVQVQIRFR